MKTRLIVGAIAAVSVGFLVLLLLHFPSSFSLTGEPVPGAEVTLEQEPDDQPMMSDAQSTHVSLTKSLPMLSTDGTFAKNRVVISMKGNITALPLSIESLVNLPDGKILVVTKVKGNYYTILDTSNSAKMMTGPYSHSYSNIDEEKINKPQIGNQVNPSKK